MEEKIKNNLYKKDLGNRGEEQATLFLENKGYFIVDRNFKCRSGEIDIVAKKNREYVFIEVKTRTSKKYGRPIEAVNKNKIKHIINTSKYYILKNNLQNFFIRYDIIEIYYKGNKILINHIKNVFY